MERVIREGKLRVHESSCDVILSCQGHRLMAHKVILSIASPLLKTLLVQDMTEPSVLIFPDIDGNTMSLILDYIYTGSVIVYSNTIQNFLTAAQLLKLNIQFNEENNQRTRKRKVPNLLPLQRKINKKLKSCVIPSPWCPRGMAVLSDPRIGYCSAQPPSSCKNAEPSDPNNNHQLDLSNKIMDESIKIENDYKDHNDDVKKKAAMMTAGNVDDDDDLEVAESKRDPTAAAAANVTKIATTKVKSELDDGGGNNNNNKQKPFKCDDCGKCFSQLRNYKYHRSVHEGTKEFAAECPECGKMFNDRGYLSSHMKIHRDRKEYACSYCPKRFNQRVAYNMHLRIHTGVKPHECPTCGKTFSRKMLLKQHQRVHTGERPYSCPECGKTFADRSNMSLHARLHTGVKPYACNLCPKSFTKKHHLKTHMNFHTGLKPYTCEKCGLAFSQSSNMRTHYKKCILKDKPTTTSNQSAGIVDNCSDSSVDKYQ